MADKTELIGLKAANAALRRLPDFVKLETQQVMDVTAFQVSQDAIAHAPPPAPVAKHGVHIRDAITWKRRRGSAVVAVDARAFHWKYWEYGTIKMPARPFFRPAAERQREGHQRRMEQALSKAATDMAASQVKPSGG